MVDDKDIKAYISKIKTLLPVYSKPERQFINKLKENIYSYVASHKVASMNDIENQFGEPFEIVQGYIDSMDIDTLISKMSVRTMLRRITVIVLLAAIIGLSIFGGFYYKGYQYYKNTVVTEHETKVDNN